MASEIKRPLHRHRNADRQKTDLPELLTHLGYQVKRIGRYHTTAEMDSLRIKDRRTWFRYSQNVGGDAITFLQHFHKKSFPEAVEYLWPSRQGQRLPHAAAYCLSMNRERKPFLLTFRPGMRMTAGCLPTCESAASHRR